MKSQFARATVFILALGSIPVLTQVFAQQPTQKSSKARALKVGVVDIGLLFQKYKRKDDFEAAINEQRKRLKAELDKEYDGLVKMRRELEKSSLRKGSEAWLLEREKVKLAQFRWELKKERMQTALKNEVEHNTLQILKEIKGTLRQWGDYYKYDIILKTDSGDRSLVGGAQGTELEVHFQEEIFRAQISDVAYVNGSLDVTESVLSYLNKKANIDYWKKQAAKAGQTNPPPAKNNDPKAPK